MKGLNLNIFTRGYAVCYVHMYKFCGKVHSCCKSVDNFHGMETHIHIDENSEIAALHQ